MMASDQFKSFCRNNSFADLYRGYDWGRDQWEDGFADICRLEIQLRSHLSEDGISLDDVKDVAIWGRLRNPSRITGLPLVLSNQVFVTGDGNALAPLDALSSNVTSGIGPTYLTKVLRFAAPATYGALDTRCVRIFGKGDPANQKHDWLELKAKNYGYGWFIPENQMDCPSGYLQWLDILTKFCLILPSDCPHPEQFIVSGLRTKGVWTCADVEMALFTYASLKLE